MNDKLKFHRMTRPVKFRFTRLVFKSVGHSYEVGVSKIKYLFNYILYKLNILKRYTNNTDTQIWRPTINGQISDVVEKEIVTGCFVGIAQSALVDDFHSKVDYFYRTNEKGLKVITYVVTDEETHFYKVVTSLIKPGLIIDGKTYLYGDVPKIVRTYKEPPVHAEMVSEELLKPQVISYDLTKLMNIQHSTILGENIDDEEVLKYRLDNAVAEAQRAITIYLQSLNLHDLEV